MASYFYVLQPCNSLISELFGYCSGVSVINQPKGSGAYFAKEEGVYGKSGLEPVFVGSEGFEALLEGYPKMRAVFSDG